MDKINKGGSPSKLEADVWLKEQLKRGQADDTNQEIKNKILNSGDLSKSLSRIHGKIELLKKALVEYHNSTITGGGQA